MALERELSQSEEAAASGRPALTPRRRRSRNSPTAPIPGLSVDDEAKVNTGRQCRETRLARIGPTTPTRAGRPADASVDKTDARSVAGSGHDDWTVRRGRNRLGSFPFRPAGPAERQASSG